VRCPNSPSNSGSVKTLLFRFALLLAAVILLLLFLRWFRRTPAERVAQVLKRIAIFGGIGLLALLAATGRLPWLLAVVSAAIPAILRIVALLQVWPILQRWWRSLDLGGSGGSSSGSVPGQVSTIRTRFLAMTLDHASGALDGEVLEGAYRGRRLDALELEALLDLLTLCRSADDQSAAVLEAYLDRRYGATWRQAEPAGSTGSATLTTGHMNREEALAILGLEPDASAEDIRTAHRRLMQKLHPDRGGSDYLAAKINQAKDLLLKAG
jgi:hypothetical protein